MSALPETDSPFRSTGDLSPIDACPLCGSRDRTERDSLTPAEIARTWAECGVTLSAEGRACFQSAVLVRHYLCQTCGFGYFDPSLPGDSKFYEELQAQFPDYYPRTCPAFERAIEFGQRQRLGEVLDIGCGAGFFLDQARAAGFKTSGLDLNAKAVADCQARGHTVQQATMAQFAARGAKDRQAYVTAFEVVEHVPDPVAFMRDAVALLRPGGWLAIAVPNNEGVHALCELEPHQWPPHHLTRWRRADLQRLGERVGVTMVESGADTRHGFHIRYFMDLQARLEFALKRRQHRSARWWPELVCLAYRLSFMKRWGPKQGLGIYAFYRKE